MSAKRLRLYHRLQLAALRAQRAADAEVMAAGGITTAQAAVLAVIQRSAPTSQRAVAGQLGLSEAAVATMTTRLLRLGMLKRTPDPADARAWRLQLSAAGEQALARIEPAFRRINTALEAALGNKLEEFATALESIAKTFNEHERA
ncbi:MAG: winged helix DNA-binding protein [Hyphomonadaceae bacterium]|nr:winged helix DNA-binding protein [Hyphomonadaceae bacterium]